MSIKLIDSNYFSSQKEIMSLFNLLNLNCPLKITVLHSCLYLYFSGYFCFFVTRARISLLTAFNYVYIEISSIEDGTTFHVWGERYGERVNS
jgi:hypothetical protein